MQKVHTQQSKLFIQNICSDYPRYNNIDAELYENASVKRGLRNADGTGVLAGLTRVGTAHGYYVEEGETIPQDGRLYYRGIDIGDIIHAAQQEKRFAFEECVYLLLFGRLPTTEHLAEFQKVIAESRVLPENFTEDLILKAPSPDIMNKLGRSILGLYSYDPNPDETSLENMLRQSIELIARSSVIAAHAFAAKRHYYDRESLHLHFCQDNYSIAENFLHMVRPDSSFTAEEARLLDLCMVLHADHGGGNNSTFTTRVLSSSGTDTYSAISAAVGSLKGPKHGGANIKVMDMFADISKNVAHWDDEEEVEAYLEKIIRKQAGDGSGLIYGMGHAVYTLSDPRAILLRKYAAELADRNGMTERFKLMETVERLTPGVFARVKGSTKIISANVDMYSGLVYETLNIPEALYTPLFAVSRVVGWCAHRIEEVMYAGRIIRPAYKAVYKPRPYKTLAERTWG